MEPSEPSKETLRLVYKAILRALIQFHGVKHAWIATRIEMRNDTFSKWYNCDHRSLSMEEINLFCAAMNIHSDTIELLLHETLNFKASSASVIEYVNAHGDQVSSLKPTLHFGKEGFMKVMLLIEEQMNDLKNSATVNSKNN